MFLIAVDPGKTTGVAYWVDGIFTSFEAPMDEAMDWCEDALRGAGVHVILVCERFDISQRTLNKAADAHWAMEQIGVLRRECRRGEHTFELQGAYDAKHFCTDERLRQLGWYQTAGGGHANDAARHTLLGLTRHGETGPLESVTPL